MKTIINKIKLFFQLRRARKDNIERFEPLMIQLAKDIADAYMEFKAKCTDSKEHIITLERTLEFSMRVDKEGIISIDANYLIPTNGDQKVTEQRNFISKKSFNRKPKDQNEKSRNTH